MADNATFVFLEDINCSAAHEENNNLGNFTDAVSRERSQLQNIYRAITFAMLIIIMLAMGCGITIKDLKQLLRRPWPVLIGLSCQFLILPGVSFGLAHALHLKCYHAIGMIIISACPGGVLSNFFTYWSRGDLTLSVCMTACSTILAVGFMPLNLFIYLRSWVDPATGIPWLGICLSIVSVWVPAGLGVLIRNKARIEVSVWITRIGSLVGLLLIVAISGIQRHLRPEFFHIEARAWIAAFVLPSIGYLCGLIISAATCRPADQIKAITYETGLQNGGIAMTIVAISFRGRISNYYVQFPLLYSVAQLSLGALLTALHMAYYCIQERRKRSVNIKEDSEQNGVNKEGHVTWLNNSKERQEIPKA